MGGRNGLEQKTIRSRVWLPSGVHRRSAMVRDGETAGTRVRDKAKFKHAGGDDLKRDFGPDSECELWLCFGG